MIQIKLALPEHVEGISKVCFEGQWATYGELLPADYIERVIKRFYSHDRILDEITVINNNWNGWFVALENGVVIGAGGGGLTGPEVGEVFVLYLDPERRNEGIGTMLLDVMTQDQKSRGAKEQWVSVQKNNQKGIPFYEARGFIFQHEQKTYETEADENYVSVRFSREI